MIFGIQVWSIVEPIMILVLTFGGLVLIVDFYRQFARPAMRRANDRHTREQLRALQSILGDIITGLWSSDTSGRLAALATIRSLSATREVALAFPNVLIAFVRDRLTARQSVGDSASFEDVKSALIILSLPSFRALGRAGGQAVDFSGLDFSGMQLAGLSFAYCRLAGCKFDACVLRGVDFTEADLAQASFKGADMRRTMFVRADLSGADLSETDMSRAIVTRAKLSGVNIRGAIMIDVEGMTQIQLDEAIGDIETAIPEGLRLATIESSRRSRSGNLEAAAGA